MPPDSGSAAVRRPKVLCAGIAVLDQIFRVPRFPVGDVKTQASAFLSLNGGNAANAAFAIHRLGGDARFVGPLGGPAGDDPSGDRFLALMAREGIDCSACPRLAGVPTPISAIAVEPGGERAIVNFRDDRLAGMRPGEPDALVDGIDALVVDNRFPEFVLPLCRAAHARRIVTVLDADAPRRQSNDLLGLVSHAVFSAEGLRATTGIDDLPQALRRARAMTAAFVGVTDGTGDVLWLDGDELRRFTPFTIEAVDTLGAGDVFHAAFAVRVVEGDDAGDAVRFAAAAAAVKCTRFGGITGAPTRAEVAAILAGPAGTLSRKG